MFQCSYGVYTWTYWNLLALIKLYNSVFEDWRDARITCYIIMDFNVYYM